MIHLFGCSFTYGSGLVPDTRDGTPTVNTLKYVDDIWGKYLLQINPEHVENYGVGGSSNAFIREEIIRNIDKFKKGDIVIIGVSSPSRISIPFYHSVTKEIAYINLIPTTVESLLEKYEKSKKGEKMHYAGSWADEEYMKAACDWYIQLLSNYEDFLYEDSLKMLFSLQSFLDSVGVRCIIWDNYIWSKLETISVWTKRKIVDSHWSPNGHRFFSLIMAEVIKRDNSSCYIDTPMFKELYSKVHKQFLNFPYVKYEP